MHRQVAVYLNVNASFSILSLRKTCKITMACLYELVYPLLVQQLFDQLTDFREVWNGRYAIGASVLSPKPC
jgi:hypothetical protein